MAGSSPPARWATRAGRRALAALVCRLPPAVLGWLRRPAAAPHPLRDAGRLALCRALRRGGIPARVRTFTLAGNQALSFVNADSLVLRQLYWLGEQGWEPELVPWWRYFCLRSSSVLEVGANVGYYTVQGGMVAPHARYVAVEPHPASVAVCRANLAVNGIHSVEVVAAAAVPDSAQSSTRLLVPWEQLATPTVAFLPAGSELPATMARRTASMIEVPAVDIRSLLAGVDLVKIDAEGQEHALLAASREHLHAERPTIVVEVLPGSPKLRALLVELCEVSGYRCYAPARDRLVPLPMSRILTFVPQEECGGNDLIISADPDAATARLGTRGDTRG
jgi:FkbM family methyltransferase